MVELVDPSERAHFNGAECAPGATTVDGLGLVEADDGLGQGVVRVAAAVDRGLDPGLGEAFGVANRAILTPRSL